jgi:hypothetical protein
VTPANDNETAVADVLRMVKWPIASRDVADLLGATTKLERRAVCRAMWRAGWRRLGKTWSPGKRWLRMRTQEVERARWARGRSDAR